MVGWVTRSQLEEVAAAPVGAGLHRPTGAVPALDEGPLYAALIVEIAPTLPDSL